MNNSKVQSFVARKVVEELSSTLHTQVSVGHVSFLLFHTLKIEDLKIQDLKHKDMLHVDRLDLNFDLIKIISGKFEFGAIKIGGLFANVEIDKSGKSNVEFLIKALTSKKKTNQSNITYSINQFELKNSTFHFTNFKVLKNLPKNVFNPTRFRLRDINAQISLEQMNNDTLNASVLNLSAIDQSGLCLSKFSSKVILTPKELQLPNLYIALPNSNVQFGSIQIQYDSLNQLTQFGESVKLKIPIEASYITFSDLAPFAPLFLHSHGAVRLIGEVNGRLSSLHFKKIELKYGASMLLKGDLDVSGLPDLKETFVFGNLDELKASKSDLQDLIADITRKAFVLPSEVDKLGMLKFKGNVTGFISNLVAYGHLDTNLGDCFADMLLKFENDFRDIEYKGTIKTENFELGKLLPNSKLGDVSVNFYTEGRKHFHESIKGTVRAVVPLLTFNTYAYRDIELEGKYDGKGFDGFLDVWDENIDAHFIGKVDMTKSSPEFLFDLDVESAQLNELKLINAYPNSVLSFKAKINLVGGSLDDINGMARFENFSFTNQNKRLELDRILFVAKNEKDFNHFSITSELLQGSFTGKYKYSTLSKTIARIFHQYLPSIQYLNEEDHESLNNHLDIDLSFENLNKLTRVLNVPYEFEGVSSLRGMIDDKSKTLSLKTFVHSCNLFTQRIDSILIDVSGDGNRLNLSSSAIAIDKNDQTKISLNLNAFEDDIENKLIWKNSNTINNAGELDMHSKVINENGKIGLQMNVLPSQIIISDSAWTLHPSTILVHADSTISINNFKFVRNASQFVYVNGIVSKNHTDSLCFVMSKLNLDFVMKLVKLQGISLGGIVSGRAALIGVLNKPIFEAGLFVKDFSLNQKILADGFVSSKWDKVKSRLLAKGVFVDHKMDTFVVANGVYTPRTYTLYVTYKANNASLEFLSRYFGNVIENFKAYVSGDIRMYGPLKHGVTFEGNAYVSKAQLTVANMHTSYYFSDSVHLKSKFIEFRKIKFFDQERNSGVLTASLKHNGLFQNLKYDMNAKGDNILGMNTKSDDNEYFFGKAYAKGSVRIFGDDKETNIVVDATTQPKTKCYTQMGGASVVADNSFVKFIDRKKQKGVSIKTAKPQPSNVNVKVNLQIDVTPEAQMELIIDPKSGDMISGRGSGNLRVEFDSFSPVKLFGTYTINNGNYLFTLQNVIRKDFRIDKGSTIEWSGNPFEADVDIRGLYSVTASLTDLMDTKQLSALTTRTTVPVNCVLQLSDDLMKPTVQFDVELPTSDDGVKQLVKSIINTNEMMNKQMIYLLVFNKFFTPEYMRTYASGVQDGISWGLTTASAQLNSWFSKMINSNNLTLGLDYKKIANMSADEYKAQILYQPSKRWIVNGNVGYRADNISKNKYIKDVDVEYLLTDAGKVRAKVYNQTVDKYQVGSAVDMQGISVVYKESFADLKEMKKFYLELLGVKKQKHQVNVK